MQQEDTDLKLLCHKVKYQQDEARTTTQQSGTVRRNQNQGSHAENAGERTLSEIQMHIPVQKCRWQMAKMPRFKNQI